MPKKQDTTLAVLTHILGLITGFIGPLVLYLVAKDNYTKEHSKHALNWQISYAIYIIISMLSCQKIGT